MIWFKQPNLASTKWNRPWWKHSDSCRIFARAANTYSRIGSARNASFSTSLQCTVPIIRQQKSLSESLSSTSQNLWAQPLRIFELNLSESLSSTCENLVQVTRQNIAMQVVAHQRCHAVWHLPYWSPYHIDLLFRALTILISLPYWSPFQSTYHIDLLFRGLDLPWGAYYCVLQLEGALPLASAGVIRHNAPLDEQSHHSTARMEYKVAVWLPPQSLDSTVQDPIFHAFVEYALYTILLLFAPCNCMQSVCMHTCWCLSNLLHWWGRHLI
jgi:hypothetical protein